MKILRFNPTTTPARVYDKQTPLVRISASNIISFNIKAIEILNLNKNSKIEFIQDQQRPKDWYVFVSPDGYMVRNIKHSTFGFCCKPVVLKIRESLGIEGKLNLKLCKDSVLEGDMILHAMITKPV